ncbi:F-box/FBD/LRR-repeat protein At1g13570-like [Bidens hawaiensis]|uniref:F-box/FBD/LRR-repeat protein At1g13570-like n=1 Tax=Bidens hawaiensis TaxID=980011 RepID=UPI00404A3E7E
MRDEDFRGDERPNIMELFKCLPVIEHLTTWGYMSPLLVQDSVPRELSTLPIHLKYFCMEEFGFGDGYGLPFLCVLIKYSPSLEKIKLQVGSGHYDETEPDKLEEYSVILEKYPDVWLEHLNELEIIFFENSKLEMEFVKFIVVRSPGLKKVKLQLYRVGKNEELKMLNILLSAPHASPVEIVVENLNQMP